MTTQTLVSLSAEEKLDLLRRLDRYRVWDSLDDQRFCLECGQVITGRQIEVSGGSGAFDPLRATCPTEGCVSVPMDWSRPEHLVVGDAALEAIPIRKMENEATIRLHGRTTQPAAGADALAHSVLYRAWRAFTLAREKISAHTPRSRG